MRTRRDSAQITRCQQNKSIGIIAKEKQSVKDCLDKYAFSVYTIIVVRTNFTVRTTMIVYTEKEKPMSDHADEESVLPEDVPVAMPDLPLQITVNTAQQFKALGDPMRWRILRTIRYRPATAKQIADILESAPGTVGHHLQVLEAAGLVKVVARRLTHGIIAKYYTRVARVFCFDFPSDLTTGAFVSLDMITRTRDEMAESMNAGQGEDEIATVSAPSAKITAERVEYYRSRMNALVEDFVSELPDPDGQVYTLFTTLFKAPPYVQRSAGILQEIEQTHKDE